MNPYLAIARREWRFSRLVYLYFLVISTVFPFFLFEPEKLSILGDNTPAVLVLFSTLIPLMVIPAQIVNLRAIYNHPTSFLQPNAKRYQFIYSLCLFLGASLLMSIAWGYSHTLVLISLVASVFIGSLFWLAIYPPYRDFFSIVGIVLIVGFALFLSTDSINDVQTLLNWFVNKTSTGIKVSLTILVLTSSSVLYYVSYRLCLRPAELDEQSLPITWAKKPSELNNRDLLTLTGGRYTIRLNWMRKFIQWPQYLRLIDTNNALEKGLYTGEATDNAMVLVSLTSILCALLILLMGIKISIQDTINPEGFGLIVSTFLILVLLVASLAFTLEFIANKPLMVQLNFWFKGSRLSFMRQMAWLHIKRQVRFLSFFTLSFFLLALVICKDIGSYKLVGMTFLYWAGLLPIIMAFGLAIATRKKTYSPSFRYQIIFSIIGLVAAYIFLTALSVWNPLGLFVIGMGLLWKSYNHWCVSTLEAID